MTTNMKDYLDELAYTRADWNDREKDHSLDVKEWVEEVKALEKEVKRLREERDEFESNVNYQEEQNAQLRVEYDTLNDDLDDANARIQELEQENEQLKVDVAEAYMVSKNE